MTSYLLSAISVDKPLRFVVEITPVEGVELDDHAYMVNALIDAIADYLPPEVKDGIAQITVYSRDTEYLAVTDPKTLAIRHYSEEEENDGD